VWEAALACLLHARSVLEHHSNLTRHMHHARVRVACARIMCSMGGQEQSRD